MDGGNNFPWGAVIMLTIVAFGTGYIAFKAVEVKNQNLLPDERDNRIA